MDAFEKLEAVGVNLSYINENTAQVHYPDGQKQMININVDVIEFMRTYLNEWTWAYGCPVD